MPHYDLTTIGESMLRLSVPAGERMEMAARFDVSPGGAEANVAGALAGLGLRTAWFSSLPDTPPGRLIAHALRRMGVDLSSVVWREGGRVGTYYVEYAVLPRAIHVTYDRANSCAAALTPADIDWARLLDTRLLHLTGITPALSAGCGSLTIEAYNRAQRQGVPISFDVNYRAKLWTPEQARAALTPLMQGVWLLMCSARDARTVFGLMGDTEALLRGLAGLSGARHVVMSLGAEGAAAWDGTRVTVRPALPVQIIDRIGAGDALAAGVIYGLLDGDLERALEYGVTLAALALSQHGDLLVTHRQEVEALVKSARAAGDVER